MRPFSKVSGISLSAFAYARSTFANWQNFGDCFNCLINLIKLATLATTHTYIHTHTHTHLYSHLAVGGKLQFSSKSAIEMRPMPSRPPRSRCINCKLRQMSPYYENFILCLCSSSLSYITVSII